MSDSFSPKCSTIKNFNIVLNDKYIDEVLSLILTGFFKKEIIYLRQLKVQGNEILYKSCKEKLFAFTPSATFNKFRRTDNVAVYNGIIILDLDKLPAEIIPNLSIIIHNSKFTYGSFISPSGCGIKILVRTDGLLANHKKTFSLVKNYYETLLNDSLRTTNSELRTIVIDKSGSDVTRLCFFSYDRELYFNSDSEIFKTL